MSVSEKTICHNDGELAAAINHLNPSGIGTENNLLKLEIALNAMGTSTGDIMDSMKSDDPNCPFLIIPSR